MQTRGDVAAALEVTDRWLCNILYGVRERDAYLTFEIPKRNGGVRVISSPPHRLRWLQKRAYLLLKGAYRPKPCVHGFTEARSIVSNAALHVGCRFLVNFDLDNFFPSIHVGRIIGVLRQAPYSFGEEAAQVFAQICCRGEDGKLPQGGVTSPLISNL